MPLGTTSFFSRTKFRIANAITPIKQAEFATLHQIDFELSRPKSNKLLDVRISTPKPSANLAFSKITTSFYQANLLSFLPPMPYGDPAGFDKRRVDEVPFSSRFPALVESDEYEFWDEFDLEIENVDFQFSKSIIQYEFWDEIDIEIENIDFQFSKSIIQGKNYRRKNETPKLNLFPERDNEDSDLPKTSKPKIERQYTDQNKFDDFDVFDLIFPALQPPLGNRFDNPLVFPKPLLSFQPDGIEFLISNQSALLGDEMGLGKSIQAIVALRVLFSKGEIKTCCIVCKKAMLRDWRNYFWEWAPELKVITIEGTKDERRILWSTSAHVYICNYESLQRDLDATIRIRNIKITDRGHEIICPNNECRKGVNIPFSLHHQRCQCPHCNFGFYYPFGEDIAKTIFDALVFDEIQETKNPLIKKTKAIRILYGKYKWALTGTPLENTIEDLITICETIKPNIFEDVNPSVPSQLISAYKPFFLRRKKEDVLKDLAKIESKPEWLELSASQRRKYDIAEREGTIDLEGKGDRITIQHVFALISKLKQICNYDPETGESCKLEYLKEKLEELTTQNDKALVFSQFPKKTLELILPHLAEFNPLYYHGQLSLNERENIVKKFQDENNIKNKVMLLSLKSGNSGITLTRANYVFHYDLWWNPAVSSQAAGRAHRFGQVKTVIETMLLAENTIERRIFDILESKKNLFNVIVDDLSDTDNPDKLLTEDEIFGLFGLQKNRSRLTTEPANRSGEFHSLDPFEFEEFVGGLFLRMGYHTKVTKRSNDGGVDIYAKLQTPTGMDEVIIQCKHKEDPQSPVDVGKVRELFGVYSANRKLTKAILVTNGRFTPKATEFAESNGIELIDGTRLQGYVKLYF